MTSGGTARRKAAKRSRRCNPHEPLRVVEEAARMRDVVGMPKVGKRRRLRFRAGVRGQHFDDGLAQSQSFGSAVQP